MYIYILYIYLRGVLVGCVTIYIYHQSNSPHKIYGWNWSIINTHWLFKVAMEEKCWCFIAALNNQRVYQIDIVVM